MGSRHDAHVATQRRGFPEIMGALGATVFVLTGIWALAAPQSFFDVLATFDPYNRHLIQDIGAFQIGLGAVLVLAIVDTPRDALSAALIGTGIGGAAHVLSHVVGMDLGGSPSFDIPVLSLLAGGLVAGGIVRRRRSRERMR